MQGTYAILIMGKKTEDPQFEPHAGIKNGAGSGISSVYLWFLTWCGARAETSIHIPIYMPITSS